MSTEMASRLKFLPERQISARQMTRCDGRPSEWLSWQSETTTTTLARSFLTHSALESDDDDGDGDGDERKAVCATKVVFDATSFA